MTKDLPIGWGMTSVRELANLIRGVTFKKSESSPLDADGLVPIIRAGNVSEGRLRLDEDLVFVPEDRVAEEQFLRRGDIVVATSSGSASVVGKSALVRKNWRGAHGAFMAVLRPLGNVDAAFLAYCIQEDLVRNRWREAAAGTNINNLKRDDLLLTEIPLCPISEQRRIVAAIEEHFSRLDAVEAVAVSARRRLDVLRNAILDRTFYDDTKSVRAAEIGDLAEVSGGIQKQPKRRPSENRYPFLRVANVGRGHLDLADVHEIELFEGEIDRFRLTKGDLLIVEGNGSINQIGRAALWGGQIEDCVHQNHLIRVRPGEDLIPEYLALCWNSPRTAQQIRAVASSTSGLYTLSTSKVNSIRIPVVPLSVQRRVVEQLDQQLRSIYLARSAAEDASSRVRALRRAVLAQAFSGQLVPQDPNDEPASAQLERIAHSR